MNYICQCPVEISIKRSGNSDPCTQTHTLNVTCQTKQVYVPHVFCICPSPWGKGICPVLADNLQWAEKMNFAAILSWQFYKIVQRPLYTHHLQWPVALSSLNKFPPSYNDLATNQSHIMPQNMMVCPISEQNFMGMNSTSNCRGKIFMISYIEHVVNTAWMPK